VPAHVLFFPAGALYAAIALPLSVAAMLGAAPWAHGLTAPYGHAHEMLFGFALAAVAGNQLGPLGRARLAILFGTWIGARIAFVAWPQSAIAWMANAAFAGLLAWQLLPRILAPIRKLRNRALPAAVMALCAAAAATHASVALPRAAVLLLVLLMLFMGGRIIAPAAAGQMYRQGEPLSARVQPRLEGLLVVLIAGAIVAVLLRRDALAGASLIAASGVAAARLARWRLWKLGNRPDMTCLAAGYGWLIAGAAATGVALWTGSRIATALHVITVGAIGTLTINVMALTWARLARRDPARQRLPVIATVAIAMSTAARVAADFHPADRIAWLAAAAALWSAAYLLLVLSFVLVSRAASPPSPARA